jgi:hypothetical protein
VAALGDQAFAAGFSPGDLSELLPFIEGYAVAGKLDRALALSQEAAKQPELRPRLCFTWKQVSSRASLEKKLQEAARKAMNGLDCQP